MAERRLTVSTQREAVAARGAWESCSERVVPLLRLRGRWLEELGFAAGSQVAVSASPGRLVITSVSGGGVDG